MNSMTTTSLALLALGLALFGSEAQAQTTVAIAATDDTAAETTAGQPANPANIRITRTGSTAAALTVWVKVSGSAVQGVDYTFPNPIGSFVIIPAGSAELDIPVNPRDDFFTEGTETVRMDLEAETAGGTPVPYTIGASDRARVNLLDNEDPNLPPRAVLSLTVLGSPAREVASNSATFRIVREGNLAVALDVHYTLAGTGTPGADFVAPPGRIAIPAGATFADVTIVAINFVGDGLRDAFDPKAEMNRA